MLRCEEESRMRVLITCQPSLSHVTQLVPLARALRDRGHDVTLATSATFVRTIRAYGLAAEPVGPDFLQRDGDPVYDRTVGERLFFGFIDLGTETAPDLVELAERKQIDVVIRENTEFGGWLAARRLGLALVTQGIMHRLPPISVRRTIGELRQLALDAGAQPADGERALYGELYLDVVPPSFRMRWERDEEFTLAAAPSWFEGTGSAEPEWLAAMGRDRPLLYVTLGTIYTEYPKVWDAIAGAVSDLDADVLMTIGPATDRSLFDHVPANVRIERFIPQSQVLPRTAAIICHAGFNTLVGAFRAGVPAVCLPVAADQPFNAAACATAGAGINAANNSTSDVRGLMFDPTTLVPGEVRAAIDAVLHEPGYREASARIGEEIRHMPSAGRVAQALETRLERRGGRAEAGRERSTSPI
jgi:UDP:flavonoid glycosyltransferase YjiC (YdhE family)